SCTRRSLSPCPNLNLIHYINTKRSKQKCSIKCVTGFVASCWWQRASCYCRRVAALKNPT
ncbi:hypothetical protein QG039_03830, partial [Kingella kingae]|nr:hypothetical protein [Kingella kingae]MDK4538452.1 hypothetical protein [Kingella kingae]